MRLGTGNWSVSCCSVYGGLSCGVKTAGCGDLTSLEIVTSGALGQGLPADLGSGESDIFRGLYDLKNFLLRKEILLLPSIMTLYWR